MKIFSTRQAENAGVLAFYTHTHTEDLVNLFNKYLLNFVPDIVPLLLLYLFLLTSNLEIGKSSSEKDALSFYSCRYKNIATCLKSWEK